MRLENFFEVNRLRYGLVTVFCEHSYETWCPIYSKNSRLDGLRVILAPQEDICCKILTVLEGSRVGCNETKISTKSRKREAPINSLHLHQQTECDVSIYHTPWSQS
jgi:hypothetical protein